VATGILAKTIAEEENQQQGIIDHGFMAGLLRDSGKLVLAANFNERYRQVPAVTQKENISLLDGEREVFGITHSEVGAYLMGLWGLPIPIVEALAFHHCPSRCMGKQFTPLTAVHIANALDHEEHSVDGKKACYDVDSGYLANLNLADRLPVWMKICQNIIQGGETDE
jgi:HD-like signal output (HDOD) protein